MSDVRKPLRQPQLPNSSLAYSVDKAGSGDGVLLQVRECIGHQIEDRNALAEKRVDVALGIRARTLNVGIEIKDAEFSRGIPTPAV